MNLKKLKRFEQHALKSVSFHTFTQIDKYIMSIQEFLQKAIDIAVLWARPSQYAKPFWTDACSKAIKNIWRLHWIWFRT